MNTMLERKKYLTNFKVTENDAPLIDRLTFYHQAILYSEGSYVDIAARLGLNLGTVKSRMHRARTNLVAMRAAELQ